MSRAALHFLRLGIYSRGGIGGRRPDPQNSTKELSRCQQLQVNVLSSVRFIGLFVSSSVFIITMLHTYIYIHTYIHTVEFVRCPLIVSLFFHRIAEFLLGYTSATV